MHTIVGLAITALFPSSEVQERTQELEREWDGLEEYFQSVSREFGESQALSEERAAQVAAEWSTRIEEIEKQERLVAAACYRFLAELEYALEVGPKED